MCGIAAFSLTPNSKVNARQLSHALLTAIEHRGSHASGFAYNHNGQSGVHKLNVPGSQLSLSEMPRRARTVILHTRYATQGDPKYRPNNHPVLSVDNTIALVHNGVISNDHTLRGELGLKPEHGTVDSLVIPSLIAQKGVDALDKLRGYAAIAWIDTEEQGTLRIARLQTSPVHFTHLLDGSFVMASTEALLRQALDSIGQIYGGIFAMEERRMMSVAQGFIDTHEASPSMAYNHQAWKQHSSATSGGHGTPQGTTTTVTTPQGTTTKATPATPARRAGFVPAAKPPVTVIGTPPTQVKQQNQSDRPPVHTGSEAGGVDEYLADLAEWRKNREEAGKGPQPVNEQVGIAQIEEWRRKGDERDAQIAARAMGTRAAALECTMDDEDEASLSDEERRDLEFEALVERLEREERESEDRNTRTTYGEGFYILSGEGDLSHYPSLADLESHLKWLGKMGRNDQDLFQVEEQINWVNHIFDIGSVDDEGRLISWVDDMSDIDEFESPAVRHLNYVREGVGLLVSLKGS